MHLPDFLIDRYKDWKNNISHSDKILLKTLVNKGQKPKAMIITCCDSRINTTKIFKAEIGDFFIHRNIANLVPSFKQGSDNHATFSTIEYAIKNLKIPNIIILGHSNCGGIEHAYNKFSNNCIDKDSHVDEWLAPLQKTYELIDKNQIKSKSLKDLEKLSIINSISNLLDYEMINKLVSEKKINICGLWLDIKSGDLMSYNQDKKKFENIS